MQYKIGDKVILKSKDELITLTENSKIIKFSEAVVTICDIGKRNNYAIKEMGTYGILDSMIECLAEYEDDVIFKKIAESLSNESLDVRKSRKDLMDEVITNADSFFEEGWSEEVEHDGELNQKDIDIILGVVSGDTTKFTEEEIKASQKRYKELQEENSHRCNLIVTNPLSVEEEMFERIAKLEKRLEEQEGTIKQLLTLHLDVNSQSSIPCALNESSLLLLKNIIQENKIK